VIYQNALFVIGSLCSIFGFVTYGRSILKKETYPSIGGLLLFSINTCWAAFYSQEMSNVYEASVIWVFGVGNTAMLLFTLFLKSWAKLKWLDVTLMVLSIAVFVVQSLFKNPSNAIIFSCLIEGLGTGMVLVKMWQNPGQENLEAWVLGALSYIFGTMGQVIGVNGVGWNMAFSGFVVFNTLCVIGLILIQERMRKQEILL
jgi:hypothetical protein